MVDLDLELPEPNDSNEPSNWDALVGPPFTKQQNIWYKQGFKALAIIIVIIAVAFAVLIGALFFASNYQ